MYLNSSFVEAFLKESSFSKQLLANNISKKTLRSGGGNFAADFQQN